ncbi:1-aminocyclopropane-1-carboxylate deaminase/D-cysteine desulfhydrase [Candidatus Neomarinimicrobiota bacterium]
MQITPIQASDSLSLRLGVDVRIKRDDLLPGIGGGNKVRKIEYILREAIEQDARSLVTHGGTQSNHARIVALKAAELGWRCKLILHGEPSEMDRKTGNLLLMDLAGAEVQIVPGELMMAAVDKALVELEKDGSRPFNILGGGHSVAGARAYADAMTEVADQLSEEGWIPDTIVVPSGTGSTQAGIVVGIHRLGWPTRVIGISVGRPNTRGRNVVEESCTELVNFLGLSPLERPIDFRDDWLCGGYEKVNAHILSTIRMVAQTAGLILDPTYTGKAFTGLMDIAQNGEIARGEKVLFWHTGGLLNLLSSTYF